MIARSGSPGRAFFYVAKARSRYWAIRRMGKWRRLHNTGLSVHVAHMRRILFLILLPVSLIFAILVQIFNFAGLATFREDSPKMLEDLWSIIDVVGAWFSTPPLWATVFALIVMVIAYVVNLFGRDRLLSAASFLFKKETRIAQLQSISDDTTVKAFRVSALAKRLLEETDWNPYPQLPLPHATSKDQYKGNIHPNDYMYFILETSGIPEERITNIFENILLYNNYDGEFSLIKDMIKEKMKIYKDNIVAAKDIAYSQRSDWEEIENGRVFYDKKTRRQWHEMRCQREAVNRYLPEIKKDLERLSSAWKVTPDSETLRQLLEGIG